MKKYLYILMIIPQVLLAQKYDFLVGTYTEKGSDGIYYCTFDGDNTKIISHTQAIKNPSFLCVSKNNNKVFSVSETAEGKVLSFDFNPKSGNFTKISEVASGGADPCYISLDQTEKNIFVGNYSGGSLALIHNQSAGLHTAQLIKHIGSGPNKERQEKSHVHSVNISPDQSHLFVCDLGTDKVINYKIEKNTLKEIEQTKLSAGSGPRHLAFHPTLPFAYIIQELNYKISSFGFKNNRLKFLEEKSTLPPEVGKVKNSCADIHISPDGRFLYGSNRYYDTIVGYRIDQKTGLLTQISQTPCGGKTPRNFAITKDGKYMFVANQDSDNIAIFKINNKTGALTKTDHEFKISMPVCIQFLH